MNKERSTWQVGELARATGLTVRTLHYYDEIGLLTPSERSTGGYRLYSGADVERLYRVCLLRRIGLPLAEIAEALADPSWSLAEVMRRHHAELERKVTLQHQLQQRLAAMLRTIDRDGPSSAELLETLEEMTMLETVVQKRITLLVYADIEAAHDYLVNVFGLGPGLLSRDADGTVVHGEVDAGDGVIWMHQVSPEHQLNSPRALGGSSACLMVTVDDVDAHYAAVSTAGAEIVYAPTDMPYGVREYSVRDPEGFLWSFSTPLG
jgi:DNA-binding transcriptional MerR regulator/uncharacterized glyoxalase superfamily protein PhnB